MKEERKKRDYESLFASNVALRIANGEDAEKFEGASTSPVPLEPPAVPQALPPTPQGLAGEETALRSLLSQSTPASGPANPSPNPRQRPLPGKGNPASPAAAMLPRKMLGISRRARNTCSSRAR